MTAPIDYRSPPPLPRRSRMFSVATFLSLLTISLALLILSAISAFHFEQVFRDFGVALPAVTAFVLWFSRMFLRGGWIAPLLVTIAAPFLVPLALPSREVTPQRMVRWVFLMLATLLLVLAIGALFFLSIWLPMHSLMTNIGRR